MVAHVAHHYATLLTAIQPKAVLFWGNVVGCEENQQGRRSSSFPIAAIRGEVLSTDYFPPEVPALPDLVSKKPFSLLSAELWP